MMRAIVSTAVLLLFAGATYAFSLGVGFNPQKAFQRILVGENIGRCYGFRYPSGADVTDCMYQSQEDSALRNDLRAAIGVSMLLGPWADEEDDIVRPALMALADGRPIAMNFTLRSGRIDFRNAKNGFLANLYLDNSQGN